MKKKIKDTSSADLFPTFDGAQSASFKPSEDAPLAVRVRPETLDQVFGQSHLLEKGKLLRRTIESDRFTSIIFYGPPGCGKTTLAQIISRMTHSAFAPINAVTSNVAELRVLIDAARKRKNFQNQRTILFIDEIHRFNKAQQDVLMPDVEQGIVILIGATTYNPAFVINSPLLSRSVVFELRPLSEDDLQAILKRALKDEERGFGKQNVNLTDEALIHLVKSAAGDARRALTALEIGLITTEPDEKGVIQFDRHVAEESCQRKIVYHDRDGDYHYDIASAFIKSMRGSDPDAAVYWLAKMLYGGEDPRFIIRRILILASEDIGNADPQALILASAGLQAIEFVGMPEARIILSQLVTYMALAPKSNASYMAIENATKDLQNEKVEEVPNHLRDRSYKYAKKLGHGEGYQYAHKFEDHYVKQEYMPKKASYYQPTEIGFEKKLKERFEELKKRSK